MLLSVEILGLICAIPPVTIQITHAFMTYITVNPKICEKQKITLAFSTTMCYYIEAVVRHRQHPGVAKFGIALEWGSRGLEFESRHSDQKTVEFFEFHGLFLSFVQCLGALFSYHILMIRGRTIKYRLPDS